MVWLRETCKENWINKYIKENTTLSFFNEEKYLRKNL